MHDATNPTLIHLQPRGYCHSISQGRTVLTSALDGSIIQPDGDQGLWVYQTRMLSCYRWLVNGNAPTLSAMSAVEQHRDLTYYIFPPSECEHAGTSCDPAQQAVEIRVERVVGEGLREQVTVTNHTQLKTTFHLELQLAADFADPAEAHGLRKQKGDLSIAWDAGNKDGLLTFNYKAQHKYKHQGNEGTAALYRGLRLQLTCDQKKPEYSDEVLRFKVHLKPKHVWHATLQWVAHLEGVDLPFWSEEGSCKRQQFRDSSTLYSAPTETDLTQTVLETLSRSGSDLAALRLLDQDANDSLGTNWIPAAGIPIYLGFFGRDILFSSRQTVSLNTENLRGSLRALSHHLGDAVNDWRDEQPGRMVHELHTGPLATLNYTPHGRYFGTVTGSFFYPSLVAELWRWTGKIEIIRPFIEPALRGLRWADKYSRDGSGFYKYQTRSTQGEKNQGWKDSGDAIVHADGSQVSAPLGTCEMQAYIYGSKMALSEVLAAIGENDRAAVFASEAAEFKKRFHDFFWMPDEGFLAMGIDSKNRPIRSIASDPGHCLLNGIVDDSLKESVAKRLMAEDMFSGWGIRTLSAKHPAFNPFSYHCGSVWPIENAMFVMAMAQAGLHDEASRLAKGFFETAALFQYHRLPEVFAGHPRDQQHPFPGLYPKANSPQAWSASGAFLVMQAILGIHADAPNKTLRLDPHLPAWLPAIHVSRLRVGDAVVDLHFARSKEGGSSCRVIDQWGTLDVVHGSRSTKKRPPAA